VGRHCCSSTPYGFSCRSNSGTQAENGGKGVHRRCPQLMREFFSVGHFALSLAKFCRYFKEVFAITGSAVRILPGPPHISHCYITTFYFGGFPCKPSVRFEEFRLGNSLVRPRTNSLLEICGKHRANSPFGVSPVRLRDVDELPNLSPSTTCHRAVDQLSWHTHFASRLSHAQGCRERISLPRLPS
jgi:hypothetical protein